MTEGSRASCRSTSPPTTTPVWGWGSGATGRSSCSVEPADKAAEVAGALRMALEEERPHLDGDGARRRRPGVEQGDRMLVKPDGATERSLGDGDLDQAARRGGAGAPGGRTQRGAHAPGLDVARPERSSRSSNRRCGSWSAAPVTTPLPWSRRRRTLGGARSSSTTGPSSSTASASPMPRTSCSSNARTRSPRSPRIDARTHVVVMSHNFLRDKDYIRSLLTSPARFIAMLGPAVRTERLLTELRDEGVDISDADRARIRGPGRARPRRRGRGGDRRGDRGRDRGRQTGTGRRVPQGPPGPIHERHAR